jgi:hypothetical protein
VQPKARVEAREQEGDRVRVALSIWCENQDGEKVLVGTASCAVPARGEK